MKLDDFTAWQWELAIAASRFHLHLLSDVEIIAFTHRLMDKGYYDDLMLDLIDINPSIYNFNAYTDFKQLWLSLDLPYLDLETSGYLNLLNLIYEFIPHPFNFPKLLTLSKKRELYYTFGKEYFYKNLLFPYLVNDDLKEILSYIKNLDDCFILYLENHTSFEELMSVYMKLNDACENWLEQNQDVIFQIMHHLYCKKLKN